VGRLDVVSIDSNACATVPTQIERGGNPKRLAGGIRAAGISDALSIIHDIHYRGCHH
jgi:hypothetical protein